jgi:Fe-S-cluster-containing hydrogenase component 2
MMRKIIKINEDKCNGCGLCADACHEGAIAMVDGVAKLIRDDYCDGLGDCLPVCPTGAITFEEREAAAYDEEAVKANMEAKRMAESLPCGCPGSSARAIERTFSDISNVKGRASSIESRLSQWPVQIKLVPVNAPYFQNANLLISADCAAYAHGDFHNEFIKNRIVLIGCPKLDQGSYAEKLTAIIKENNIKSVTVVRMEVPCCGGLENAVKEALKNSGKMIPWQIVTIAADGMVLEE